ncbi:hypothetical protein WMY93_021015 [Mugilogobius chulae]|uniref:Spexin n=1 Tax=Mugilogobius chulae TaxID=88201 RepID=A0AAW0NCN9_9GOBI
MRILSAESRDSRTRSRTWLQQNRPSTHREEHPQRRAPTEKSTHREEHPQTRAPTEDEDPAPERAPTESTHREHPGPGDMTVLRKAAATSALTALLLATLVSHCCSAPKNFQRRNWTPQAMLYLKGTQGRRFVTDDHKEGDVYDTLHLETRSQNTDKLSVEEASNVLLNLLQQARQGVEELPAAEVYLQELPVWRRQFF